MPQFRAFIPGIGEVRRSSSVPLTHAWAVQYTVHGKRKDVVGWADTAEGAHQSLTEQVSSLLDNAGVVLIDAGISQVTTGRSAT